MLEKTLESPLDCKEIQPVNPKGIQSWLLIGRCWCWNSNSLATWCEELTHWKRPWCWQRLKAGREGDDRRWDGWMASLTQWIWVWISSGSCSWTWKPGALQSMGLQRVGHDWAIELNWIQSYFSFWECNYHHKANNHVIIVMTWNKLLSVPRRPLCAHCLPPFQNYQCFEC